MDGKPPNDRRAESEVDSIFTDRWSPRAFLSEPLAKVATDKFPLKKVPKI